jgi:NAD(P)-dependent dehydrogenase (short-subunit alcohol dehydrogenase family)
MDTPMLDRSLLAMMIAKTPTGRVSTVDDVAAAAMFLNSAAARSVNGVSLAIDGGATAVFNYGG